ncbi:MAG TPA: hypothetical protein PKZ03_03180 [Methanothrix sp.]|uniref:hypothetical protein n=2 Tax=Methanothrix sp. TaxID=90426 RepID=UPI002B88FD62|nr:hypothetical protein [Methanothrix sp.]
MKQFKGEMMVITIESKGIELDLPSDPDSRIQPLLNFNKVILNSLIENGYVPLITNARRSFLKVLGGSEEEEPPEEWSEWNSPFRYRIRRDKSSSRVLGDREVALIVGDLFLTEDAKGILYEALLMDTSSGSRIERKFFLGCGYMGEKGDISYLDGFIESLKSPLSEFGITNDWFPSQSTSSRFMDLANSSDKKFLKASEIDLQDFEASQHLENKKARDISLVIKRSGSILSSDLFKKLNMEEDESEKIIADLIKNEFITKEYVIICKNTQNQINKVKSLVDLEEAARLGILCACGRSISEERVEELFVPTSKLQKLLDKSYWLTVRLVDQLVKFNTLPDHILLNLQEGSDEIDAFVDMDGILLMFELKDAQFSMGHAYPFSGRIGLYNPNFAIIISTDQVEPQVKKYFAKIKPDVEIVYVENLDQLPAKLDQIISKIKSVEAYEILSLFDPLANVNIMISKILSSRIGINLEESIDYDTRGTYYRHPIL